MHLRPGERIGDWIVDDVLGEGGMGAVYRAHSTLTERLEAAIKVMKPALGPEFRARFVREAEALSALRHPSIVRVMGFAEDPKRELLYLVMELAYGETLKARMARGPMGLPEALQVFVPLASALDHAHGERIFHRDLKPANVVLCEDGPRLVDFGIAAAPAGQTLTDGTGQLGTLAYLPPEVFRGLVAESQAIDVYGFGLLLHEALTGTRIFPVDPRTTPAAAAAAVGVRKLQQAALDPGDPHPERLREMVRRATDPDPGVRPSMAEMRQTLESLVERRGRSGAKGAAAASGAPARISTPPADHTMRVPDPPKPAIGDLRTATPVRFKPRPGRPLPMWIPIAAAAGGLAILLALGLALLGGGAADAPDAPDASPPSATSPDSPLGGTRRAAPARRSGSPSAPDDEEPGAAVPASIDAGPPSRAEGRAPAPARENAADPSTEPARVSVTGGTAPPAARATSAPPSERPAAPPPTAATTPPPSPSPQVERSIVYPVVSPIVPSLPADPPAPEPSPSPAAR